MGSLDECSILMELFLAGFISSCRRPSFFFWINSSCKEQFKVVFLVKISFSFLDPDVDFNLRFEILFVLLVCLLCLFSSRMIERF